MQHEPIFPGDQWVKIDKQIRDDPIWLVATKLGYFQ